ncbi:MAG: hypothetical protein Q8O98_00015 [bacterium]|nr:hypothetical protein [bacterium]
MKTKLVWLVVGLFVGGAIMYFLTPGSVSGLLSENETREIALNVISEKLNIKITPDCLSLDSERDGGFVIYQVTRKFNTTCYPTPVDYSVFPDIPNIKIDLKSGATFFRSLDGMYQPI